MDAAGPDAITPGRRFVLTVGLMLATGLQFMDGTVVAIVLNHMQGSLSATHLEPVIEVMTRPTP